MPSSYTEREPQRTTVGLDASGGDMVYRVASGKNSVPFSTTEYVRIDSTRNKLVVTDGESFSEPLLAQFDRIRVFCDSARNRVIIPSVQKRAFWTQFEDPDQGSRIIARWASNRYDGATQDWLVTSASGTSFVASPAGTAITIPAYTLRDYGRLEIIFAGLLTGDATNAQTLRQGFLRNGVDNTTVPGATQFDGGAGSDSMAISGGISAATACPFFLRCEIIPIAVEGAVAHTLMCIWSLWTTTTNGAKVAVGTGDTLVMSASGTTPFDGTIDNVIVPVFRRSGTAATLVTWDIRSMTAIHHAERRF